ncbi:uncharacterized protein [Paralichthys olivaceus]|uniref:uncharacterized protein n=1 Tax=Paralichthys olivaceus TaxID=8255 RepID=UPI003752C222
MRALLRNLSQSIFPGVWHETTGLEIQGFPRQPYGQDCGIFMLMYALYSVLDAPYDFTVVDMPALRKWWCVMLLENFELGSYGKVFAHWTDISKSVLQDEVPPVFHLKKRKMDDNTETEEQPQPVSKHQQSCTERAVEMPVDVDEVGARILHHCKKAAEWVETNQHLFSAKVELPCVLTMGEEEVEEVVRQYRRLWDEEECCQLDNQETEDILDHFKFKFENVDDMWVFCDEIVDKRGYTTYTETQVTANKDGV